MLNSFTNKVVNAKPLIRAIAFAAIAHLSLSCEKTEQADFPRESLPTPIQAVYDPDNTKLPETVSYAPIVEQVANAVITIHSESRVRAPQQYPYTSDPMFQQFFGNPGNPSGPRLEQRRVGLGSGVIVTSDGYILTNHHVVDGAEMINVDLSDGRRLDARLVGTDPPSDLAVLKIEAVNLPVLTLGNSARVRIGDVVLAIGNPLGIGQTVTMGIISAKGRQTGLSDGSFEDFLQTDAPINQGNSGGALVSTNSELIGINSQILSPSGGSIGIGFAVPSNMARSVLEQLISGGTVRRGQLGITVQKDPRGIAVGTVQAGSPAERAGLKPGDIITAYNGEPVSEPNAFRNAIAATTPGTEVTLTVLRNGSTQQLNARLGEFTVRRGAPQ